MPIDDFEYDLVRYDHNGKSYHVYTLLIYARFEPGQRDTFDDPGCSPSLEITRATCGGELFELTQQEEQMISNNRLEEILA